VGLGLGGQLTWASSGLWAVFEAALLAVRCLRSWSHLAWIGLTCVSPVPMRCARISRVRPREMGSGRVVVRASPPCLHQTDAKP